MGAVVKKRWKKQILCSRILLSDMSEFVSENEKTEVGTDSMSALNATQRLSTTAVSKNSISNSNEKVNTESKKVVERAKAPFI